MKKKNVIEKYVAVEYEKLKTKLLEASAKGYNTVYFKNYIYPLYDDISLTEFDFIPTHQKFINDENTDPNIGFEFGHNCISFHRLPNKNNLLGKDCFFTQLLCNINSIEQKNQNKALEKENKKLQKAKDSYEIILEKMKEASQKGESEIQYDPLHGSEDKSYYCNSRNFDLHKQWLHEANSDMVVWLRRTNSYFSAQGGQYNLCWREKYYYEKLASGLRKQLYMF